MEALGTCTNTGVSQKFREVDAAIARELSELSLVDRDYWTFRRGAGRRQAHGLSQYPAMMVPPMQAVLMGLVTQAAGNVDSIVDPFLGSGTTLVEAMRLGLNYTGQDVNPLAILISRTKAGPFHVRQLQQAIARVGEYAATDVGDKIEADFPNVDKWFNPTVARDLSRLRRAIRREKKLWCRRVLWTAMAETVRRTSNSRTSTFKLHIRTPEDIQNREKPVTVSFLEIAKNIATRLVSEADQLRKAGRISQGGWYRGEIEIHLANSARIVMASEGGHGLLITSPPYGDNTSTVPYGQYSYLPLQWIDLEDIDPNADANCLISTYEIDSRSLGGDRRTAIEDVEAMLSRSPSLGQILLKLQDHPVDRRRRVAAFCRDLDVALGTIIPSLRPNAYMIWTVGNRCVGGFEVPTDQILVELLSNRGADLVTRIERHIPNKRMATRNNIASTIRGEAILLFRKAS
jgi:hypothetical protein